MRWRNDSSRTPVVLEIDDPTWVIEVSENSRQVRITVASGTTHADAMRAIGNVMVRCGAELLQLSGSRKMKKARNYK